MNTTQSRWFTVLGVGILVGCGSGGAAAPMRDTGGTSGNPDGHVAEVNVYAAAAAPLDNVVSAINQALMVTNAPPKNLKLAVVANGPWTFFNPTQIGTARAGAALKCVTSYAFPSNLPVVNADGTTDVTSTQQSKLIKNLVGQGYLGIAVSASDSSLLAPTASDAVAAGVTVTTFDKDMPSTGRLFNIGTNNYAAGYAAGKKMAQLLKNKGNVLIMQTPLPTDLLIARRNGFLAAAQETGLTITDCPKPPTEEQSGNNETDVRTWLAAHPDTIIDGVFTTLGWAAAAAGHMVDDGTIAAGVKIVSFDTDAATQMYLKKGIISAMVSQNPYHMGYLSTYILYAVQAMGLEATRALVEPLLSGENRDQIDTGSFVITLDDLATYNAYQESLGVPPG